jgi:uncharacterized phiE125 gp8 family phage protein
MYYDLVSQSAAPVSLSTLKTYLKLSGTSEDAILTLMLEQATECGEKYTGRSFRVQTWDVFRDYFDYDSFEIRLSPVDSIDSITYINESDVPTVVDSSIYYLKKGQWFSEIVLKTGEAWPSDVKDIEQAITFRVSTIKYPKATSSIDMGILQHVAYVYSNRGDCSCDNKSMKDSGAKSCYDAFRISRV